MEIFKYYIYSIIYISDIFACERCTFNIYHDCINTFNEYLNYPLRCGSGIPIQFIIRQVFDNLYKLIAHSTRWNNKICGIKLNDNYWSVFLS